MLDIHYLKDCAQKLHSKVFIVFLSEDKYRELGGKYYHILAMGVRGGADGRFVRYVKYLGASHGGAPAFGKAIGLSKLMEVFIEWNHKFWGRSVRLRWSEFNLLDG